MSAPAVEPGGRLADRFRLEDRVSESGGATLWKAIDEVLARPVSVLTLAPTFERVVEVVTAARGASRLTDPRLTQVFDAAEENGQAYVVSEWVTGETLTDMVSSGPLSPERAAALVAEAAEAVAHAHRAGLSHLCLTPDRLVWTAGSTVKLLGLAVDASLGCVESDDPAREDAQGLGRLLYTALTGHWPGGGEVDLPHAPLDDGKICTPRQVTAGVPGFLDAITCRALLQESRRGLPPLSTPAEVAEALAEVPRPAPVPVSGMPPALALRSEAPDDLDTMRPPRPSSPPRPPARSRRRESGGMAGKAMVALIVVLVIAAVGLGAWTLGRNLGKPPTPPAASAEPSKAASPKLVAVKPSAARGFDPQGTDRDEHPEITQLAIDGKSSTEWHTDSYQSAEFGRLKEGVGLLLDMGRQTSVADVVVSLGDAPGASVQLRVGDNPDLGDLKKAAEQENVSGTVTLTPSRPASGQYVLIWFTRLPAFEGKFRGTIYDVVVHSPGSA
ncbi:protein kinase family protein [Sphaerisporangium sp. TRM90804]|uniref:protein kinase family protein n=1 Tax=Sphaerisporangium sp. TRM90804 TaxID=3031113 RepID=UPI00244D19A7|nr:protein kinase family protein [Sphaerisporangium sp. TRM90804]MDH2425549.1 protein kinase family protein [Sphaerisporangium sp. TRM90804]